MFRPLLSHVLDPFRYGLFELLFFFAGSCEKPSILNKRIELDSFVEDCLILPVKVFYVSSNGSFKVNYIGIRPGS